MANIERLQRVMDHIMDNPQHHFQGDWITHIELQAPGNEGAGYACGTAACFAGWATLLYAEEVGYQREGKSRHDQVFVPIGVEDPDVTQRIHVRSLAIQILDLKDHGYENSEATVLFSGGNSRSQLQAMVKDLANGEDIVENYRNGLYRREKV